MVHHFADDTNLLLFDSSLKTLQQKKINIDLKFLCHWLNANKISLNTNKTEYIYIYIFYLGINKNLSILL